MRGPIMKKLLVLTAFTSASILLAGCNSAPKEEAPAEPAATETAAPEAMAAPDAATADAAATDAAAAPAAEATDGSDDTETGGGGIKPVDSGK